MRPVHQAALTSVTAGAPVVLDYRGQHGVISLSVTVTGTNTSKVQHTLDDVFASGFDPSTATWYDVSGMTALSTSTVGKLDQPATAVRLNCTAYTSGSCQLNVIHGVGATA